MDLQLGIRIAVGLILCVGFGISGYHRRRAAAADASARRSDEATSLKVLRVVVALPAYVVLAGSLIAPSRFGWATVAVSPAVQLGGVGIAALGVPLVAWLFPHLGHNVTATTLTKESHVLVTTGPYRYVRHPLYLAGMLLLGGSGLALGNWVMLAFLAVFLVTWLGWVIPREEAALAARFGDDYGAYRERTGALLPSPGAFVGHR